jgi:hypothetical protein
MNIDIPLEISWGVTMNRMRIFAVVILACVMLVSVSHADSVDYTIIGPGGLTDCTFSSGSGVYQVIATLNLSAPAKALQISAPQECGGPGISWNYPVTGDPSTVLTVDFGGCITGSVTLFTAEFDVYGCCPMLLNGPSSSGAGQDSPPVLIGCDDQPRFLIPPCSASSPLLLTPAAGETGVSVTPYISWDYSFGDYCQEGLGLPIFTILYGIDPENLDQSLGTLDTPGGTLPTLEEYTQYFWRVRVWDDWGYYSGSMVNFSEIRNFTTGEAVAAERTTWGEVKSFYKK